MQIFLFLLLLSIWGCSTVEVTKEVIKTMALARGIKLSDQRAEALIPELTTVVEGLDALRSMLEDSELEPSLVFHVPGQVKHVG